MPILFRRRGGGILELYRLLGDNATVVTLLFYPFHSQHSTHNWTSSLLYSGGAAAVAKELYLLLGDNATEDEDENERRGVMRLLLLEEGSAPAMSVL